MTKHSGNEAERCFVSGAKCSKKPVQEQLLHCGRQTARDSRQQGKLHVAEVQGLQALETKATSKLQRRNKQHVLLPTLPNEHPMFWAEGQGVWAEGQGVGAEGPLCREGELCKTPEGLDDICHLAAKREQLAHYMTWTHGRAQLRMYPGYSTGARRLPRGSRPSKNICSFQTFL